MRRGVPARRKAGWFPRCSATSTCTGSTGRGDKSMGELVRYADDLVVMCATRQQAEDALALLTDLWPISVWSPRRPRPGSCTWRRVARGSTSSAFTTAGARVGPAKSSHLSSSPAGPRTKRCNVPATGSVNSRPGPAAGAARRDRGRTSTGSCAAGPGTSVTGTRLVTSTRSGTRAGTPGAPGGQAPSPHRARIGHVPVLPVTESHGPDQLVESSSPPGPSGTGGGRPNAGGERRR